MKEPVRLGPGSTGDQPLQGSLEPGQGAAGGGSGSHGERQRAQQGRTLTPKPQGRCQAHLGGALGKQLLLLEPPDRRPEELNTTSNPSSTPQQEDPGDNTHATPHLIFTPPGGCRSAGGSRTPGQVSSLWTVQPPPAPLPLHPPTLHPSAWPLLPSLPSPPPAAPGGRGAPIQDQAVPGREGAQPQSPGPELPSASGLSLGAPGGTGTWHPGQCVLTGSVTSDGRVSLGQAPHLLPFQGNLKLPSSKQLRYSGFY